MFCLRREFILKVPLVVLIPTDKNIILVLAVSGRCSAELGPETNPNGSGSKNDVECTKHKPRRSILRPFRHHVVVQTEKLKYKLFT